jgi:hypothetical protein
MKLFIQQDWRNFPAPVKMKKFEISLTVGLSLLIVPQIALSQTPNSAVQVVVNSNQDGPIAADDVVTLREAIAIANGTLPLAQLSPQEKAQVLSLSGNTASRIEFNLPPQQTTITLKEILPPITQPGLVIEGTTQPGYNATTSPTADITIPQPVVAITSVNDAEIIRGLSIAADGVTIRGLSIYGFNARPRAIATLPPADIFIAPLPDVKPPAAPPKDIIIENNWLGMPPDKTIPVKTSAFGVSVFNSLGTTIQRNRIADHDGSGIITSIQAANLQVKENIIVGNGRAGIPDAIRLEGMIENAEITANLIRLNAGSGLYLFKPEGSVKIRANTIDSNGQKLRRGAIYLMGNNHEVVNNQITQQSGPGVVVAAYPRSRGNRIVNNQFSQLQGLSIDLVTQQNAGVKDYQQGDGANPKQDSYQRQRKTANLGIDAPRFLSPEFFISLQDGTVALDGFATPGSVVEIYQVTEPGETQGPLNKAITTVNVNADGKFSAILTNLKSGDCLSAIATHPQYGTSEPAINAVVRSLAAPVNP